ncbi:hypothetical protein HGRIS_004714 [Hohenbuehelia grisea]|uniref:PCI domain-containing protein n=1 Tax=Hohenbuehelia grisea TaxID=104357 RepID=A0ABR3JCX1_9AGAR
MSSESWPPQLKDWVARCLGQMSDTNRKDAQEELRQVIAAAFSSNTLWTTDWAAIQLKSLQPKPPPNFSNLKRKSHDITPMSKKAKKAAKQFASSSSSSVDFNDQEALNRRAQRFQREHDIERQKLNGSSSFIKSNGQYSHLNGRFQSRSGSPSMNIDDPEANPNVPGWDAQIVGTSTEVFKDYLRLTSEPKPEQIRPLSVLRETLVQLKSRWRNKAPYNWICSQFKSLRQDLTVQRIKNDFTVEVYEIHARMALESNDMVEFNQCQATLKTLYALGIPGKVEEFTAYRILLLLHGRNSRDLNLYVGQLTPKQKADQAVEHALAVLRALSKGNYHSLFLLYLNAPNMGAYIMDHFIPRERVRALMVMSKAYRTITLAFVRDELGFENLAEAREFLTEHSASFFTNHNSPDDDKVLDCKPMAPQLNQVFEAKYRKVGIHGAI